VVTTYRYDGDNQRALKSSAPEGDGNHYFVHGPGGQLLGEYADACGSGTGFRSLRDYVYAGSRLLATVRNVPTLGLPSAASVRENAGNAGVVVTLSTSDGCPAASEVTVAYATVDGTAKAGTDYVAAAGTLSFPKGSPNGSTQVLSVGIVNDTFVEPTKSFRVVLTSPAAATLGVASETISIVDNDTPAVSLVSDVAVSEGAGSAQVQVKVVTEDGNALHAAVSVRYASANGTAVAPSDYTIATGVLTFAAGTPSGSALDVVLHVADDTLAENTELFTVALSAPSGAVLGTPSKARVTILDNEPTVGMSLGASAFAENAGAAVIAVSVTTVDGEPTPDSVTVRYATVNGTALAGKDYAASSGVVSFPGPIANGTTKTISVPILDDGLSENGETFVAILTSPTSAHLGPARHVVTILDEDPLPAISIADASVKEPAAGRTAVMNFTVSLSAVSGRTVSVGYATADGSAQAGSDYTAKAGTLALPAGTLSKLLPVTVLNDGAEKGNEAFLVSLLNPAGAVLGRSFAQGTIIDSVAASALCVPIAYVPYTIAAPGRYCVQQDLTTAIADGNAITIAADSVVLDLQGFTLDGSGGGPATLADGVYAEGRSSVAVRNGTVRGFHRGIVLEDGGPGSRVEGIQAEASTFAGIWTAGEAVQVKRNRVTNTGRSDGEWTPVGIFVKGPGARLLDNEVVDTVAPEGGGSVSVLQLSEAAGAVVRGNRIANGTGTRDATGIDVVGSIDVLVLENRLTGLDFGIVFESESTGKYRGNLTSGVATPYTGGTDAGGNQ
jgi:hypothetical protein